jgi:hypothetical protein
LIHDNTETKYAVIVSVNSTTSVEVNSLDGWAYDENAVTAYQAFECCLEWDAKTSGQPGWLKRFRSVTFLWEMIVGVYEWTAKFTSGNSLTSGDQSVTGTHSVTEAAPLAKRVFVPADHHLTPELMPKLCIKQGGARFRITGISIEATPVSDRVNT